MSLSTEPAARIKKIVAELAEPVTRYRVSVFSTHDIGALGIIARVVRDQLGGSNMDALDFAGDSDSPRPIELIDLIKVNLRGRPHCLQHADPIIATWTPTDRRIFWEQLALIEAEVPLLATTARPDLYEIHAWVRRGEFRVGNSAISIWVPRRANRCDQLAGEIAK
jgi:hypothetical protein